VPLEPPSQKKPLNANVSSNPILRQNSVKDNRKEEAVQGRARSGRCSQPTQKPLLVPLRPKVQNAESHNIAVRAPKTQEQANV
jgi:hypothetical protein